MSNGNRSLRPHNVPIFISVEYSAHGKAYPFEQGKLQGRLSYKSCKTPCFPFISIIAEYQSKTLRRLKIPWAAKRAISYASFQVEPCSSIRTQPPSFADGEASNFQFFLDGGTGTRAKDTVMFKITGYIGRIPGFRKIEDGSGPSLSGLCVYGTTPVSSQWKSNSQAGKPINPSRLYNIGLSYSSGCQAIKEQ